MIYDLYDLIKKHTMASKCQTCTSRQIEIFPEGLHASRSKNGCFSNSTILRLLALLIRVHTQRERSIILIAN